MGVKVMEKPTFNAEQLVSSSAASKHFGELRRKAKSNPLFITDNGNIDSVLMDYSYFEKMYCRIIELEKWKEEKILVERIEKLEKNPSSAVSWSSIRRSVKEDE